MTHPPTSRTRSTSPTRPAWPSTSGTPTCVDGRCGALCAAGFGDCDGNVANACEVNTLTSVTNCGGCGQACPSRPNATASCSGGVCRYACAANFGECDG